MKNILGILILFSAFIGILSGVKYLDVQSAHYQTCAVYWSSAADATALYPRERAALVEKFKSGESLELNGRACPRLLTPHKAIIETKLSQNHPTTTRGLRGQMP